jgi:hypothetical protein
MSDRLKTTSLRVSRDKLEVIRRRIRDRCSDRIFSEKPIDARKRA